MTNLDLAKSTASIDYREICYTSLSGRCL